MSVPEHTIRALSHNAEASQMKTRTPKTNSRISAAPASHQPHQVPTPTREQVQRAQAIYRDNVFKAIMKDCWP